MLVSLGRNGGLASSTPTYRDHCTAPRPCAESVNTVGAGDGFLAGWLAAAHAGATSADAFANALRFGATAVEHEGTLLGAPDPRRPVSIVPAEAQTPLS